MGRLKNNPQMKKDELLEKEINEMEASNLSDKEFKNNGNKGAQKNSVKTISNLMSNLRD